MLKRTILNIADAFGNRIEMLSVYSNNDGEALYNQINKLIELEFLRRLYKELESTQTNKFKHTGEI